jgi:hypothetical protein
LAGEVSFPDWRDPSTDSTPYAAFDATPPAQHYTAIRDVARRRVRRATRWVAFGAASLAALVGMGVAAQSSRSHATSAVVGIAAGGTSGSPVTVSGGSAAVAASTATSTSGRNGITSSASSARAGGEGTDVVDRG